jgi:deoxycytidylate deaminase
MTIPSWSITNGIKAYITGIPCIQCLSCLVNSNVKEIIYNPNRGWSLTEVDADDFNFLIEQSGIKLTQITI